MADPGNPADRIIRLELAFERLCDQVTYLTQDVRTLAGTVGDLAQQQASYGATQGKVDVRLLLMGMGVALATMSALAGVGWLVVRLAVG